MRAGRATTVVARLTDARPPALRRRPLTARVRVRLPGEHRDRVRQDPHPLKRANVTSMSHTDIEVTFVVLVG